MTANGSPSLVVPLRVRQGVLDEVIAHARADAPDECCGLLLGGADILDLSVPTRNVRRSPTRFEIDPADHFAAIRLARSTGRLVCGAYHSHPRGPAVPSPTDAAELSDSSLVHVIVSLETHPPSVRAFRWRNGNFVRIDLVPVP
jgi:proteasome lid subunit RPN8/RPN11